MKASDYDNPLARPGSNHDFAGAEELISDLAALLDAGLVVVHEHVLGPARYGVAPVPDHVLGPARHGAAPVRDHRNGTRQAPSREPRHHARLT
jgi:hypothetical protein